METMRQDCDILGHQFYGQKGGGTSTHVASWWQREISIGKNKEYKKEKIFYMDVLKTIHKKGESERER